MSALEKLKERMEEWRRSVELLQEDNRALKKQLEAVASQDTHDIEALKQSVAEKEHLITELTAELSAKDREIEAIIEKVETLLT